MPLAQVRRRWGVRSDARARRAWGHAARRAARTAVYRLQWRASGMKALCRSRRTGAAAAANLRRASPPRPHPPSTGLPRLPLLLPIALPPIAPPSCSLLQHSELRCTACLAASARPPRSLPAARPQPLQVRGAHGDGRTPHVNAHGLAAGPRQEGHVRRDQATAAAHVQHAAHDSTRAMYNSTCRTLCAVCGTRARSAPFAALDVQRLHLKGAQRGFLAGQQLLLAVCARAWARPGCAQDLARHRRGPDLSPRRPARAGR